MTKTLEKFQATVKVTVPDHSVAWKHDQGMWADNLPSCTSFTHIRMSYGCSVSKIISFNALNTKKNKIQK
jgi:hypothetical protein